MITQSLFSITQQTSCVHTATIDYIQYSAYACLWISLCVCVRRVIQHTLAPVCDCPRTWSRIHISTRHLVSLLKVRKGWWLVYMHCLINAPHTHTHQQCFIVVQICWHAHTYTSQTSVTYTWVHYIMCFLYIVFQRHLNFALSLHLCVHTNK